MITKGKNIQFYTWESEGRKIQVVGEKIGGSLVFSFYINKEKIAIGEKISSSSPLKVPLAKIPSSSSYPARATTSPTPIINSSTLNPPKFCHK